MILTRVRAAPFGCFADKEVRFAPGMNVVLGPNEAGKSTVYRAIRHALFVPSKLKKNQNAQYLDPYLPAGGGDSIVVGVDLEEKGKKWLLRRRWGARPTSEMTLPTGAKISDESAILEQLASILPARQSTFVSVLMTGQAELAGTIAMLQDRGKDALHDLADILRQAVLQTGGVSPDRFQELLAKRHAKAFGRWDAAHGGPEGNRGLDNKWKNGVGDILGAVVRAGGVGARRPGTRPPLSGSWTA